jgi:hypothetical protein
MKISELLIILKRNKEDYPKDEFFNNGHKPFNTYISMVDNDATVKELFENIDKLFDIFKQKFKPNTIRNYCKYLQVSLHLNIVKELFTQEQISIINSKIDKILQEIDKQNKALTFVHAESVPAESVVGESVSVESMDEMFDINDIVPIDNIDNSSLSLAILIKNLEKMKILKNTFLLYIKSKEDNNTYLAWKNLIDYLSV